MSAYVDGLKMLARRELSELQVRQRLARKGHQPDAIVDKDKTSTIHGAIAAGTSQYGMQTFDQSIFSLYEQGLVTYDEALRWATNVDEFKLKVQGISTTAEMSRDQMAAAAQASGSAPEITRFGG